MSKGVGRPFMMPVAAAFAWLAACNFVIDEPPCTTDSSCPATTRCMSGVCVLVIEGGPDAGDADVDVIDSGVDTGVLDVADTETGEADLAAPSGLVASDGTDSAAVDLSWIPVDGADAYRIFRDGALLATVSAPPYRDVAATPGGVPEPVSDLAASEGVAGFEVIVRWSPPVTPAGTAHTYRVAALAGARVGPLSAPETGFRAASPITGYTLSIVAHDGQEVVVELAPEVTSYADDTAHPAQLIREATRLSEGTCYRCLEFEVVGPGIEPRPSRYVLVARNARGESEPSVEVLGWLGTTPPVYMAEIYPNGFTDRVVEIIASDTTPLLRIPWVEDAPTAYVATIHQRSVTADRAAGPIGAVYAGQCRDDGDCPAGEGCARGLCAPPGTVQIPAGTGVLGAQVDVLYPADQPRVPAWITRGFLLEETEVTVDEWVALLGADPSHFPACGPDCPVQGITWWSALGYANARSVADGLPPCYVLAETCTGSVAEGTLVCPDVHVVVPDGHPAECVGWRLPTAAEWEYAARAMRPTTTPWFQTVSTRNGCEEDLGVFLAPYGWWCGTSMADWEGCVEIEGACHGPQPVGLLEPSPWGLYDIVGNVSEWVWDAGDANVDLVPDPLLIAWSDPLRVVRGGSWRSYARGLRVASRSTYAPESRRDDVGVRLARTIHPSPAD